MNSTNKINAIDLTMNNYKAIYCATCINLETGDVLSLDERINKRGETGYRSYSTRETQAFKQEQINAELNALKQADVFEELYNNDIDM